MTENEYISTVEYVLCLLLRNVREHPALLRLIAKEPGGAESLGHYMRDVITGLRELHKLPEEAEVPFVVGFMQLAREYGLDIPLN